MSGLIAFLGDNAVLVGGIAFIGMLYSMGSKAERLLLLFAGVSLVTFSISHSIEAALGVLALGGAVMLIDRVRSRA